MNRRARNLLILSSFCFLQLGVFRNLPAQPELGLEKKPQALKCRAAFLKIREAAIDYLHMTGGETGDFPPDFSYIVSFHKDPPYLTV